MKLLYGQKILIGKEPDKGRLQIALKESGKSAYLGAPGSVPACVSRCKLKEGVAHAVLTISKDGEMTLTNGKPQNVTYVNGAEIVSKRISPTDTVQLGKDRFQIPIPLILESAEKVASATEMKEEAPEKKDKVQDKTYNIAHLEYIWNGLQDEIRKIQEKEKRVNLIRSGCGIFTMCAMPCIFLFGPIGYVMTGIGILGNIYSFVGIKNDDKEKVAARLTEEFQARYVCPNPDCNKFLGMMSYKLLKRQYSMRCPYCGCGYVEK